LSCYWSPGGNAQRTEQTDFCGGLAALGNQYSQLVPWQIGILENQTQTLFDVFKGG
jgi:hypothetical protein